MLERIAAFFLVVLGVLTVMAFAQPGAAPPLAANACADCDSVPSTAADASGRGVAETARKARAAEDDAPTGATPPTPEPTGEAPAPAEPVEDSDPEPAPTGPAPTDEASPPAEPTSEEPAPPREPAPEPEPSPAQDEPAPTEEPSANGGNETASAAPGA